MSTHSPRIEGTKAINVLRLASAGVSAQTVTIGGEVYELTTRDDLAVTAGRKVVDVTGGDTVKAQGKISMSDVPQDTGTVAVGGKTYTFQTVLTNVDGHVLIGAGEEETIDNLVAAINGGLGRGTVYATATVPNTSATAEKDGTTDCILTAIVGGTPGNAVALAEAADNTTKDAAFLGTETLGVDPSAEDVCDALLDAINEQTAHRIEARKISANELEIVAKKVGVLELACTETLAGANNGWAAAAMYGGSRTRRGRFSIVERVPLAVEDALDSMHFHFDFSPSKVHVEVFVTATPGVAVAWDGSVTVSAGDVLLGNAGSTDWSASHTVRVTAIE